MKKFLNCQYNVNEIAFIFFKDVKTDLFMVKNIFLCKARVIKLKEGNLNTCQCQGRLRN